MKPETLVRDLLAAEDAETRQALLSPQAGDFYVEVVGLLKDEADSTCLRDLNAALRIAGIAGEVAEFAAVPRCRALAVWARGNVLFYQGNYAESLALYREATEFFAAEGAEMEVAFLSSNQSGVLTDLGHYDEALQAAQTALAILRKQPASVFVANVLMGMSTLYNLTGHHDDALAACEEGG